MIRFIFDSYFAAYILLSCLVNFCIESDCCIIGNFSDCSMIKYFFKLLWFDPSDRFFIIHKNIYWSVPIQ